VVVCVRRLNTAFCLTVERQERFDFAAQIVSVTARVR
jgi:hypothetical protein